MKELSANELRNIDGGLFPIVILGVVITAKTAAWIIAGCVFAAGVYVGYKEASTEAESNSVRAITC